MCIRDSINTLTEQGEMMLTLMGTLAQNEVESTSKNVKLGIKMKMKRGEPVSYTHLDVYKRQGRFPGWIFVQMYSLWKI